MPKTIKLSDMRYYGKVCLVHPHLEGERREKDGCCPACHNARAKAGSYRMREQISALEAQVEALKAELVQARRALVRQDLGL